MLLRPGDAVILASDGLETLSTRTIIKLLGRGSGVSPRRIVERVLTAIRAAHARNQDNTTVIFYRFAHTEDIKPPRPGTGGGRPVIWLVLAAALVIAAIYGLYSSGP
jgi:serine/threonine protein phosphatase PrpC